jgi:hypothetical protein
MGKTLLLTKGNIWKHMRHSYNVLHCQPLSGFLSLNTSRSLRQPYCHNSLPVLSLHLCVYVAFIVQWTEYVLSGPTSRLLQSLVWLV